VRQSWRFGRLRRPERR